jgi:hypothetical protein
MTMQQSVGMIHTTHMKQWENACLASHNILQSEGHVELEEDECNRERD